MPSRAEKYLAKLQGSAGAEEPAPAPAAPHQAPGPETAPISGPQTSRAERYLAKATAGNLAAEQAATAADQSARTSFPLEDPRARGAVPSTPLDTTTPQDVPATIADPATRQQLARDLQTYGRAGIEMAGATSGAGLARRAASRVGLGRLAAGLFEGAGAALGEGAGALAAQPIDPLEDPLGNAKQIAAFGALGEGVAGTLFAGASKLYQGGGTASRGLGLQRLEPGARSATRLLGPGYSPTAGRLSRSQVVDVMENVVENSLTSGGAITRKNQLAAARAIDLTNEYLNTYTKGATREEIDNLISDVVSRRLDSFKASAEELYGQIDSLAPVGVDTAALIQLRNKIVSRHQVGGAGDGLKALVVAIDRTIGVPEAKRGIDANVMISTAPRYRQGTGFDAGAMIEERDALASIPFRDAQKLRSDILSAQRSATDVFADQVEGAAKRIGSVTDTAMEAAAVATGDQAVFELWRTANAFWEAGANEFGSSVMRQLAITRPDDLRKVIFSEDAPQQIRNFRRIVLGNVGDEASTAREIRARSLRTLRSETASAAEKALAQRRLDTLAEGQEAWDKFVGGTMLDIIRGADPGSSLSEVGRGTRVLQGSSALDRAQALGQTWQVMFEDKPGKQRLAERFFRTLEITQADTGLATGRLVTQFAQGSAVIRLTTDPASTITILAGPAVLARLATNEGFIRWATVGTNRKLKGRELTRAFTRMAVIAAQEGARVTAPDGTEINSDPQTQASQGLLETAAAAEARR